MITGTLSCPEPAERGSVLLLDPDLCAESAGIHVATDNMQIRFPNGSKTNNQSGQLSIHR